MTRKFTCYQENWIWGSRDLGLRLQWQLLRKTSLKLKGWQERLGGKRFSVSRVQLCADVISFLARLHYVFSFRLGLTSISFCHVDFTWVPVLVRFEFSSISFRSQFDSASISLRSRFGIHFPRSPLGSTSISCRFHFNLTSVSLHSHIDLIGSRLQIDFTSVSLLIRFGFTSVSLRSHIWFNFDITLISHRPHLCSTAISLRFRFGLT